MSQRELIILGSAAQVPTRERNHNSYFVRFDREGFLFDAGDGTQRQMIYSDVSASCITRICLTHFHGDHCLGIPGVIQRLSLDKATHPVDAYFPASGECFWDALEHASLFQSVVDIQKHPIEGGGILFENDEFRLSCAPLEHRVECYGYRLEEKPSRTLNPEMLNKLGLSGESVGLLKRQGYLDTPQGRINVNDVSVERPGQIFADVMDTRLCANAYELAKNADILLCEATYADSEAKQAHEYMHMTAKHAAILAKESGVKHLVLAHLSQRYASHAPLLAEAREIFPNTTLVKDGEHIQFPKRTRQT